MVVSDYQQYQPDQLTTNTEQNNKITHLYCCKQQFGLWKIDKISSFIVYALC